MTKTRDLADLGGGFIQAGTGAVQRTTESKLQDVVSVLDFIPESEHAAIKAGTSSYNAAPAIQAAVNSSNISTTINFPSGTYIVSSPIICATPRVLEGVNAKIKASASFTGAAFTDSGGSPVTLSAVIIFLTGNYNDIGGNRAWNAHLGDLWIDCNNAANIGVYIERMPYSYIGCRVYNANTIGIDVGPYCWGIHLDSNVVESFGQAGIRIGAAANGSQITSPKIWGYPTRGTYGIEFKDNNDTNGLTITGGFIERIDYGVFFGKRTGPVSIIGVDFEDITTNAIRAVGDLTSPAGRLVGPINCINTYLDSGSDIIYSDNAKVVVDGCRTRSTRTSKWNTANSGVVEVSNIELEGTVGWVSGARGSMIQQTTSIKVDDQYRNRRSFPEADTYRQNFYQFQEAPTLQSAQLRFSQAYHGGATGRYLSSSEWWISEYRHISAPGVLTGKLGIILNNRGGQFAVDPYVDNQHTLGEASLRWKEIFCVNNVINTSDAATKQQIEELSDAEKRVAARLKGLIRKFKFNDAVAEKGDDARIHVGVIAQDVEQAFTAEGLDASRYGVFCKDEWWEFNGSRCLPLEDGTYKAAYYTTDGGRVYVTNEEEVPKDCQIEYEIVRPTYRSQLGIRYGELLAFIIAAL